jgi:hypothetical protein
MNAWIRAILAASALVAAAAARAEQLDAVGGALVRVESPRDWSLGLRLQTDSRQFVTGPETRKIQTGHIVLRAGRNALTGLNLWGEIGTAQAEESSEKAERGLEWAAGATARIVQFVLGRTPAGTVADELHIDIDGSYRFVESNFAEADMTWGEVRLAPAFVYQINREDEARWRTYDPSQVALRAGLVFLQNEGDYGAESLEQNRDFGLLLGTSGLWLSGWAVRLDAVLYGGSEHEISLLFARNF